MQDAPLLDLAGITKSFPGVQALDNVSMRLSAGEVLALVGENGAGKSTLMKVLAGIVQPDSGTLRLDGEPVRFRWPIEAIRAGIALIHQELNLHEGLSVAENLFLGRELHCWGWRDRQRMNERAAEALQQVGCGASPTDPLANLSVAARQLVEIARAVSSDAKVVIMDEPTSSLTTTEAENLFGVVESLAQRGVGIVYISHRLGEIVRLADRVEVLRDGRNAGALTGDAIHHDAMVSAMIGRESTKLFDRREVVRGEVRLRVKDLRVAHRQSFSHKRPVQAPAIEFDVRAGEIVAIAGLVGSRRSELLEAIFGLRDSHSGSVSIDNHELPRNDVRSAIRCGLALVSEDRKATGLLVHSNVRENTTLASLEAAPRSPWLDRQWQSRVCADSIEKLRIKTASQSTIVASLSGGNQQKISLAKWLLCKPRVLLLDEPTRGVDVGAKQEIYQLLQRLSEQGMAIVFVSSEMEEVLALADRVLVLHEGVMRGDLSRAEMSEDAIMRCAVGIESEVGTNREQSVCK